MRRTEAQCDQQACFWLTIFALYFGLQAAIRVTFGQGLNIDEAEAWLWAQRLDRGYGPQPPAYIWLQRLVFTATGVSEIGLAFLKAALLWSITAVSFLLARRLTSSSATAVLAVLLLMWLPEFSWESQRIRTHNTLAALVSLSAVIVLLQLRSHPQPWRYPLLGALFGLGILSKWNFGLLIPPVLLALALEDWRKYLYRPAALWLLIAPALMVLPTALWMIEYPDVAFASSGKLGMSESLTYGQNVLTWLSAFFEAFVAYAALPVVIFVAFSFIIRSDKYVQPELLNRGEARFVALIVAATVLLVLIAGAAVGATQIKSRWFFPLTVPLLPVTGVWLTGRLGQRAKKTFVGMTSVLAALLISGSIYNLRVTPPVNLTKVAELASKIARLPQGELIVAPVVTAGNLQLATGSRNIIDVPMLLTGACPDAVWILSSNGPLHETVGEFLDSCALTVDREIHLIDDELARRFVSAPN